MNRRNCIACLAGTAFVIAWPAGQSIARSNPASPSASAPIRLIAPFPPGGTVDILTRALAQALAPLLGQPVVVENRGGAGGTVGADIAAHSAADGNTLLFSAAHHAIAQSVYPRLGYDIRTDFAPIAFLGRVSHVLICNNALPVTTVAQLVAYLKEHPNQLNYGTPGSGTLHHLMAEQFKEISGTSMTHVPYKGSGPALVDLVAGQIQLCFETMPSALQHIRSNNVRALAVTSRQRSRHLPQIPTIAESGLPGYDASSWYGLLAPKGTPAVVATRLNKAVNEAFGNAEFAARWAALGAEPGGGSAHELAALISSEVDRWSLVAKAAHITVE